MTTETLASAPALTRDEWALIAEALDCLADYADHEYEMGGTDKAEARAKTLRANGLRERLVFDMGLQS